MMDDIATSDEPGSDVDQEKEQPCNMEWAVARCHLRGRREALVRAR
jgi:hypothetical protein